jgi:tRNA uridine 5-carboxymethylaminomethyl modification enzyme
METKWDTIVIGGGHAGCEAAYASAKMGCKTALLTMNPARIGFLSCNPAMGGLAKGQLIKEIDALGGVMGINTDKTAIQYRRLNSSKGPAVRSSRAQCDKALYAQRMQEFLLDQESFSILSLEASEILLNCGKIKGVRAHDGSLLFARALVITTGTFLKAIMHTGDEQTEGGRAGDTSAINLSQSISDLGFKLRRLKTGTPPRLHQKSIDFTQTERQPGEDYPLPFSFYFKPHPFPLLPQLPCYITYTNKQTHDIIEENFDRSPLFSGAIQGVGPRYCPSIEDKVKRFSSRDRHQIFLEPEGLHSDEIYVNGISTSLPKDVQEHFVRSIKGLEKAEFLRFGYAVEYDSVDATQLKSTLESKDINGLFFAGQINGTSGYEEAGAQGIIAGINAALLSLEKAPFTLSRLDGYIGVLIDDLVTKTSDEPYRMFTSRAEYRLLLREDNADLRLSEKGWELGLLGQEEFKAFNLKREAIERGHEELKTYFFQPNPHTNHTLQSLGHPPIKDRLCAKTFLRRPQVSWSELYLLGFPKKNPSIEINEQIEVQIKYEGYIKRDLDLLQGVRKNEKDFIPLSLDYASIPGLSNEAISRLKTIRPETIGQASRLSGVTPAAIANLVIYLKMKKFKPSKNHDEQP